MTWREQLLSLQLLAELQVGQPSRQAVLDAKAVEDAAAAAAAAAVGGPPPGGL